MALDHSHRIMPTNATQIYDLSAYRADVLEGKFKISELIEQMYWKASLRSQNLSRRCIGAGGNAAKSGDLYLEHMSASAGAWLLVKTARSPRQWSSY